MFGKLAEAQQKAEEIKQRLSHIQVQGTAAAGKVTVTANGNRKVLEVHIADELMSPERNEELQDLLLVAIEHAMEQAENVSQSEMQSMMSSMMPGLGALLGKK